MRHTQSSCVHLVVAGIAHGRAIASLRQMRHRTIHLQHWGGVSTPYLGNNQICLEKRFFSIHFKYSCNVARNMIGRLANFVSLNKHRISLAPTAKLQA
jgi:hypothetical protein